MSLKISQQAKELHKPFKSKFPRRRVLVFKLNDTFTADLVDMIEWNKENDGYKYILNVMDVFSRYAWSRPLKNKDSKSVLNALKDIIYKSKRKPNRLWVDQGKEFYNRDMKNFLKDNDIEIYSTYGENKASIIERFNKTMKEIMFKYFTSNNTRRWVDVLDEIIKKYNSRKHKTIGMTPKEASKIENEEIVIENTYPKVEEKVKEKPKFKIGDFVRISRIKGTFEKGYLPNWSREIFQIYQILDTIPVTYKIKEFDGEPIEGSFYTEELQKTNKPEFYEIEEVLDKRKIKGKTYYLVKYLGYDNKYNEWVSEENLKNI